MIVAGCIACAGGLIWQMRSTVFAPTPKGPDRGQAVVSYYLAGQFLGETALRKGSVLLFFPPDAVMDEEAVGTYAGTFRRVLLGVPGLTVESVTLDVAAKAAKAGNIPISAFQHAITNSSPAVAYVSFAGVPAEIRNLPKEHRRPLFVFDPWGTTNWVAAMKEGFIKTAIVPRPGVKPGPDIVGEPYEAFGKLYLMATPSTLDKVLSELRP